MKRIDGKVDGPKARGDYGSLYRGAGGSQWSWIFHRVSGVGIILFLFVHVIDTALVGLGPNAYNRAIAVYKNPVVMFLELVLVAAVLYHALNGVRIMLFDFWPWMARRYREITYATMLVFAASMVPVTYVIGKEIFQKLLR